MPSLRVYLRGLGPNRGLSFGEWVSLWEGLGKRSFPLLLLLFVFAQPISKPPGHLFVTGKGGGERARREGGRGEGKTFLRSPTLQMGAQFTNAYEQGETQGFFARALKPFEVALHPPSLGGGRALRPVPSTDSGDDERGWHGGGGGGLRGKNLFSPLNKLSSGPIVAPAL